MYARLTTIRTVPGRHADALHAIRYSLLAPLHTVVGFRDALLLTNPEAHTIVTLTLWDSAAARAASEERSVPSMLHSPLFADLVADVQVAYYTAAE